MVISIALHLFVTCFFIEVVGSNDGWHESLGTKLLLFTMCALWPLLTLMFITIDYVLELYNV